MGRRRIATPKSIVSASNHPVLDADDLIGELQQFRRFRHLPGLDHAARQVPLRLGKRPRQCLGGRIGRRLALVEALAGSGKYLLATLNNESAELNQARIDRAGFLTRFFRITLPLLKPVLVVTLLVVGGGSLTAAGADSHGAQPSALTTLLRPAPFAA